MKPVLVLLAIALFLSCCNKPQVRITHDCYNGPEAATLECKARTTNK